MIDQTTTAENKKPIPFLALIDSSFLTVFNFNNPFPLSFIQHPIFHHAIDKLNITSRFS